MQLRKWCKSQYVRGAANAIFAKLKIPKQIPKHTQRSIALGSMGLPDSEHGRGTCGLEDNTSGTLSCVGHGNRMCWHMNFTVVGGWGVDALVTPWPWAYLLNGLGMDALVTECCDEPHFCLGRNALVSGCLR